MVFELFRKLNFLFVVFLSVFVCHFNRCVCAIDLHPAALKFFRGNSGPWRAYASGDDAVFFFFLVLLDDAFDVLHFSIEERFYFDFWTVEHGVSPVNIWFEVLTPWVSEYESVLPEIGDIEGYSLFLSSLSDKEVCDMCDRAMFVY